MNLLFCDRIAPRQALRVRSATQVILTPTPRSQLSYKGHSLALPTSIFGSRADTGVSGQGPPQFYGEVPFPQATKKPRIYEPAGSCSSPVAPRRLPGQVLVESKHRLVPLDGFLPICVSPQMQSGVPLQGLRSCEEGTPLCPRRPRPSVGPSAPRPLAPSHVPVPGPAPTGTRTRRVWPSRSVPWA